MGGALTPCFEKMGKDEDLPGSLKGPQAVRRSTAVGTAWVVGAVVKIDMRAVCFDTGRIVAA